MKSWIFSFLLLFFMTPLFAATQDVQRETRGYGASYQEALSAALMEAVRQIRGLEVGTEKVLKTLIVQSIDSSTVTLQGSERMTQDIYTKSQGWIKTYDIVEVNQPETREGQWEVVTLVTVPVYKEAVGDDKRKTIAVMPFEVSVQDVVARDSSVSAQHFSERVSQGIISEITQSRKFAVVNRAFDAQFAKERELLRSSEVSSVEASRLGRKLGADFIIVGTLHNLTVKKNDKTLYGVTFTSYDSDISLFYSVVETATEKVMWADTVDYHYTSRDESKLVTALIASLSSDVVTNILDVIYPIKILALEDEQNILLNQGGRRLKVGQRMSVFTEGRKLKDFDTNMTIKIDGTKVAKIEVTHVLPKYSIAKFITGDYQKIHVKAITRRIMVNEQVKNQANRPLTPGSSDAPLKW